LTKIKTVFAAIVEQFSLLLPPFLVSVYLSTHIDLIDYGEFYLAYTVYTFLTSLNQAFFVEAYGVLASAKYADHRELMFQVIFKKNIIIALFFLLVCILMVTIGDVVKIITFTPATQGIALLAAIALPSQIVRSNMYVAGRFIYSARLAVIGMVSSFLVLLWIHLFSAINQLLAYIVLSINFFPHLCFGLIKYTKSSVRIDAVVVDNYRSDHIQYSKWVLPTAFVFQLYSQNSYWLAKSELGSTAVAKYRLIQNIILPLSILSMSLSSVSLPLLAQALNQENRAMVKSVFRSNSLRVLLFYTAFIICVLTIRSLNLGIFNGYLKQIEWDAFFVCLAASFVTANGHILNDVVKAHRKPKIVLLA